MNHEEDDDGGVAPAMYDLSQLVSTKPNQNDEKDASIPADESSTMNHEMDLIGFESKERSAPSSERQLHTLSHSPTVSPSRETHKTSVKGDLMESHDFSGGKGSLWD